MSRGWKAFWVTLALVVVVLVVSSQVRVPYYKIAPGNLYSVQEAVRVEGVDPQATAGQIEFPTISMGPLTALEAVVGWLHPDIDVITKREALGDQTRDENRQRNLAAMTASTQTSSTVALRELGYEVTYTGTGAVVTEVVAESPAGPVLERGDTIVELDGQAVTTADELVEAIRSRAPGDEVSLGIELFDGGEEAATVELGSHPDDPALPYLGVASATRDITFHFPFDVLVETGEVGGPSAGLAFTLGVVDQLTVGDLAGGMKVVATGTMSMDGSVGPIGGIRQKVVTARDGDADLFLVPLPELEAARQAAGDDLEVVGVASLDDAIAALEARGGVADGPTR